MLNCDNGTYDSWYWAHPPAYMPENCNLESVKHIKKFVSIPVVCAGKMTMDEGAKAVEAGEIDGVGVARQFLVDPEWVTKLIDGREEDIRPCIRCHNACFTMARYEGTANIQDLGDAIHMARCALNPTTMQTKKYRIVKTEKPKRIAIIGGGIGGMESALVLAERGHQPTIFEKSDRLGGVFILAAAPSYKESDRQLIEWYRNGDLDFSGVRTVNLDEYKGISRENDQSYYYFMHQNLFDHVNIPAENTHLPDGMEPDSEKECRRYEELIQSMGSVDLQLLGIGHNGHIGFNEPADAFDKLVHCVNLTQSTIEANKRFFASAEEVPRQAYTMGIQTIMRSKKILIIANGEGKADIVRDAFFGPITPMVPASVLQLHNDVTLVADEAALSKIPASFV